MRSRAASALGRWRDELDRSLFLPDAPGTFRFGGREGAIVLVAFLALVGALQLFRAGPTETLSSLWAEDGPVFLGGALWHGFFDNVTTTYAEYLVLVPRLIGELGAWLPLRDAPLAMNLASIVFVGPQGWSMSILCERLESE